MTVPSVVRGFQQAGQDLLGEHRVQASRMPFPAEAGVQESVCPTYMFRHNIVVRLGIATHTSSAARRKARRRRSCRASPASTGEHRKMSMSLIADDAQNAMRVRCGSDRPRG